MLLVDAVERAVVEVDSIAAQRSRPSATRAVRAADLPELLGREDAAAAALAARDALELAQLLERVDPDVRVRADAERDAAVAHADGGEEPVAEVGLGRRARADRRAAVAEQVELGAVGVGGVHDRRPLAEAAAGGEQLDRADTVLGEALLDLPRLLVGVDVERRAPRGRVAAELLQPVARAGAHGVGGDADRDSVVRAALRPRPGRRRRTAGACARAHRARTRRGGRRTRSRPPRPPRPRRRPSRARGSGTRRRPCSRRRASRDRCGRRARAPWRRLALGLREHPVAPRPEVGARARPRERALERVAVSVDEPRDAPLAPRATTLT